MLHGRCLDPSSCGIGDRARGSALRGRGSRSHAPLPPCSSSPDRAPGQKRQAPASGHLNPTRGGRADATPRQQRGGDGRGRWGAGTGCNRERRTGTAEMQVCFPGLPGGRVSSELRDPGIEP